LDQLKFLRSCTAKYSGAHKDDLVLKTVWHLDRHLDCRYIVSITEPGSSAGMRSWGGPYYRCCSSRADLNLVSELPELTLTIYKLICHSKRRWILWDIFQEIFYWKENNEIGIKPKSFHIFWTFVELVMCFWSWNVVVITSIHLLKCILIVHWWWIEERKMYLSIRRPFKSMVCFCTSYLTYRDVRFGPKLNFCHC